MAQIQTGFPILLEDPVASLEEIDFLVECVGAAGPLRSHQANQAEELFLGRTLEIAHNLLDGESAVDEGGLSDGWHFLALTDDSGASVYLGEVNLGGFPQKGAHEAGDITDGIRIQIEGGAADRLSNHTLAHDLLLLG